MLFRKPRSGRGFSLPELLVVMAIMMLLATLLIPRTRGAKELAERAAAEESMHAIQSSQEAYRITNGSYASSFRTLTSLRGGPLLTGESRPTPGGTEDVLVYKGYVFRLRRTAPDQYTVTAEPVINRSNRDWFRMDQHSPIGITRGSWETLHQEAGTTN
ncbi:MAG: type II secretion system protein [Candidatus Acidiferrales bacterium]